MISTWNEETIERLQTLWRETDHPYRKLAETMSEDFGSEFSFDMVRNYIRRHREIFPSRSGEILPDGFIPKWGTFKFDNEGGIETSWIRGAKPELDFKEEFLKAIREYNPIDAIVPYSGDIEHPGLLEIPLFDMHFGVADFDFYSGHLQQIIGHIRKRKWNHIVITVGSDLLHHNDMRSQTAGGTAIEQLNIRSAYRDALKFYTTLIAEAVKSSLEVTVIYVKGNHDESPSWFFAERLAFAFPSVKFDLSYKERKLFLWEKIFIGYIHGDKPIADIDKVFVRTNKQAYANSEVTEIHIGHTHKEVLKGNIQDRQGVMVRVLSTGAKTDDWHDENNYVGSNKRFQLFEYSTDKLVSNHYIYG